MGQDRSENDVLMEASAVLRQRFGLASFRKGQAEIVTSILQGQDTLAIMPTGGGKSLCYQLPAMALPGVTIVVSPLISLMRDQVAALTERGIPCGAIHSAQTPKEKEAIFSAMRTHPSFLLYLSPERVQNPGFSQWLSKAEITLFAIDEAHCVSQWGHDFRPDYGKLNLLRSLKPKVPILATTATATPQVLTDIVRQLELRDPQKHVHGFYRPNLYCQVELCESEADRLAFVRGSLKKFSSGRAIIYAGTRKKCEDLHDELKKEFDAVGYYHAGLTAERRDRVQDQYEEGRIRILVATNAFGMGVDHPDVRLVVHAQMTANIESYYQEIGRAGRDGQDSTCLMLYAKKDKGLQSFFIRQSKAPISIRTHRWRTLDAMVQYCEGAECRHAEILTYFRDSERISACGHCDVCVPKSDRKVSPSLRTLLKKSAKKSRRLAPVDETDSFAQSIRAWRKSYAKSKDIPAFLVFSDRTLADLVEKKPKTLSQLEGIHGLGAYKIETFGRALLTVIESSK